jgi:hypothetical protein
MLVHFYNSLVVISSTLSLRTVLLQNEISLFLLLFYATCLYPANFYCIILYAVLLCPIHIGCSRNLFS